MNDMLVRMIELMM